LYQPLEEDELQQSLTIDIMLSSELPVVCEFEWEFHKLEVKEAARMKAIEVFFAASQLCDASALPGSIFYWFWLEVRSFLEESIKALAANNEGTYIVGGGSFGDIYHKMPFVMSSIIEKWRYNLIFGTLIYFDVMVITMIKVLDVLTNGRGKTEKGEEKEVLEWAFTSETQEDKNDSRNHFCSLTGKQEQKEAVYTV
ncbi:hypothetical protein ISN44_As06g033360, partial [Arabidopsis suecica]